MPRNIVAVHIHDAVNAVEEALCDPRIFRASVTEEAFQGLYYLQRKAYAAISQASKGRTKRERGDDGPS